MNGDLERGGGDLAGERYELQERRTPAVGAQLSLNEYLDEVPSLSLKSVLMKINDSKESIARLDTQITRIEQLHAQSLNAPEGSSHAELDSLVASTSSLIASIRANLENLGGDCRKGGTDAKKKVDLVNAQRRSLQQKVQRFQTIEKQYRDKLTERAIRQYRIGNLLRPFTFKPFPPLIPSGGEVLTVVNPDMTDEELSTALTDPNTQIFTQSLLTSTRSSAAQRTLSEVQSRHNDILAIERKITELAQMFTELGVMVTWQEEHIDNISHQAEQTQVTMEQGLQQVSRATRLAAAARRKKWWCIGIVFLIIAIVVVVVVVTQVVNKKTTNP